MNTNMRLVALIQILIAPTWAVADAYICLGEKSTGFIYDKNSNSWETRYFNAGNAKYLVSTEKKTVRLFGREKALFDNCVAGSAKTKSGKKTKIFFCGAPDGDLIMSTDALKFTYSGVGFDYAVGEMREGVGTPVLTIGTCTIF